MDETNLQRRLPSLLLIEPCLVRIDPLAILRRCLQPHVSSLEQGRQGRSEGEKKRDGKGRIGRSDELVPAPAPEGFHQLLEQVMKAKKEGGLEALLDCQGR
jgi:hypothetical protein